MGNGHGGKRAGSGRKPGMVTRKTRELADRAAEQGISPLEVMIQAMREHYEAGRLQEAAKVAKDAAPYMHPRLSAVAVDMEGDLRVRMELVEEIVSAPAPLAPSNGHP